MVPWGGLLNHLISKPIIIAVADFFSIHIIPQSNGSGDTKYDFYKLIFVFCCSLLLFFIIQIYNTNHNKFRIFAITTFRYFLFYVLLIYGFAKVYPSQFGSELSILILNKTYGDSSPMNLLWTFMGFSKGYTFFVGFAEVLAGTLLLFKRTTVLGAILSCAVMTNVFLLNLFYDVPVKLFSFHLLIISLSIILLNFQSLFRFFLSREDIGKLNAFGFERSKEANQLLIWIKSFITVLIFLTILGSVLKLKKPKEKDKSILNGTHYVIEQKIKFAENKLNPIEWDLLSFDYNKHLSIQLDNREVSHYRINIDTIKNVIADNNKSQIKFDLINDTLTLKGIWQGDTINIIALHKKREDYLLLNRGYNWINERPHNK